MIRYLAALGVLALTFATTPVRAGDVELITVERPPFSSLQDGEPTGFSIDLWRAVAKDIGRSTTFSYVDSFSDMLARIADGTFDIAVANISITAEREQRLDFSHAIFQSGLQIMVPADGGTNMIWKVLLSRELMLSIAVAFLLLLGGGMAMWALERRAQPYFDRSPRAAMFPSFWWALNLVVNGGFEERVPRTFLGRILGVFLVLSSLFIVSIFVAKITAMMTVDALQGSVNSVNDLYGKSVGTISGSTAAEFMGNRNLGFRGYPDLKTLLAGFEKGELDAVLFDAPILAYYAAHDGRDTAQLVGAVFRRESYGFALPSASPLLEPVNRSLLKLRENGTYDGIYRKYFGAPG